MALGMATLLAPRVRRQARLPRRRASTLDAAIAEEQQQRAERRDHDAPEVEPRDVTEPERRAQEAADQRAGDADQDRDDDAAGIGARHDPLRQDADDQSEDD